MAASGDEIEVTLTFERPLTTEKFRERCQGIADHLDDLAEEEGR